MFKPLTIDDSEDILSHLLASGVSVSELSFSNLFIWRHCFNTRWCRYKNLLLFLEQRQDASHYLLPPVGPDISSNILYKLLEWLQKQCGSSRPSIERADSHLAKNLDHRLIAEPILEHNDYIYQRSGLEELKGGRLQYKRSLVRRLMVQHEVQAVPMESAHLDFCRQVYETWKRWRSGKIDQDEESAVNECLNSFDKLPANGVVLFVDGRIEAFSISEALNRDTWLVLIEKAVPGLPGLYPMLAQEASRLYPPQVLWINRAQDLGIPGLRQAKHSLNPCAMLEKFRIRLA